MMSRSTCTCSSKLKEKHIMMRQKKNNIKLWVTSAERLKLAMENDNEREFELHTQVL